MAGCVGIAEVGLGRYILVSIGCDTICWAGCWGGGGARGCRCCTLCLPKRPFKVVSCLLAPLWLLLWEPEKPILDWIEEPGVIAFVIIIWDGSATAVAFDCCWCWGGWFFEVKSGPDTFCIGVDYNPQIKKDE